MIPKSDWPCWEGTEDCLAKKHPNTPSWEIASEMDDYRKAFNICKDCIVYMLKAENSVLTKQEMKTILKYKSACALAS